MAAHFKLNMSQTLFDKYGGVPVVTLIVKDFHARLMRRPNIRRYFAEMPVDRLIDHHIKYVSYALGKPGGDIRVDALREQHLPAGVTKASYDLVLDLLASVLADNGFTDEDIAQVVERVQGLSTEVVSMGISK